MSLPTSSNLELTAKSRKSCAKAVTSKLYTSRLRKLTQWRREVRPMARMHSLFRSGALLAIPVIVAVVQARAEDLNDYPTSARADYVFGCMKANGETQQLLQKCSCSIDVIASIIPYDRYVTAETVLSLSQVPGRASEFRSTEPARLALQEFRRAQAEAEIRCF
jgi:hypothetical protein